MKNLFGYLSCIAIAVLLTIYINGSGGLLVTVLLLLSGIISVAILIISKNKLSVSLSLDANVLGKDEKLTASVTINGFSFFPTCFAEVFLASTDNVENKSNKEFVTIAAGKNESVIDAEYVTKYCGKAYVRIEKVLLHDYLGIITIKLPESRTSDCYGSVNILPTIHDTGLQSEMLRTVSNSASNDNNDDSESDETSTNSTGLPGYDHRKYEPGDPLKRINWKMSAKKKEYMVRLDEKITSSSQDFYLDIPAQLSYSAEYCKNCDEIIESSLTMCIMLLRQGFECSYCYYCNGWQRVKITDTKSLYELQNSLAEITPYPLEMRFSFDKPKADAQPVCFTSCLGGMKAEINDLIHSFACSLVVTKESGIQKVCANVWTVNHDFEFTKLS